jgi:hypothetical protein
VNIFLRTQTSQPIGRRMQTLKPLHRGPRS